MKTRTLQQNLRIHRSVNRMILKAKLSITLYLALFIMSISLSAQDNIGISGSNYSPTNTVLINPSSIVDSKAFIDINLAGASVYAHNDYVYIPKGQFNFFQLIKSPEEQLIEPKFDNSRSRYYAVADINVHGPSFTFAIGEHALGLYTGVRSVTDARNVSGELLRSTELGLAAESNWGVEQDIKNIRVNSLAWGEVGLTYGKILKKRNRDLYTGAISVKKLFGIGGASVHLDNWNYMVLDTGTMETYHIAGKYGFNMPAWNSGKGWGVDVGITYKKALKDVTAYVPHNKSQNCETCDYKYKIAVAVLDIGRISFKPEFFTHEFDITEESQWQGYNGIDAEDAEELDASISDGFNLEEGDVKFRMPLPTALSFQYDYNFENNIYLNLGYIGGLPWKNAMGVQRGSQLSITPRFEVKRFEAALPVIFHRYKYPSMGLMLRLNSVIIGTDNIGTYLFNQDVYGADIYFSVKYTIFKSWKCRKQKYKTPKHKVKRRKAKPCPSWR